MDSLLQGLSRKRLRRQTDPFQTFSASMQSLRKESSFLVTHARQPLLVPRPKAWLASPGHIMQHSSYPNLWTSTSQTALSRTTNLTYLPLALVNKPVLCK